MNQVDLAVGVLSAMVIPVVMISACGSLTISTGNRLGRAVDRTRKVSDLFSALAATCTVDKHDEAREELGVLHELMQQGGQRTLLLHHALAALYSAQAFFVLTSVALAAESLSRKATGWLALLPGLAGAALLLYAVVQLVAETRISRRSLAREMEFIVQRSADKLNP